jgi:CheY-like chemotaxis protein
MQLSPRPLSFPSPADRSAHRVFERGSTILLVDDDDAVRDLLRHLLKAAGHRVLEAARSPQALTLAAEHDGTIDLLVTDMSLREINGRKLAERLRQDRPGLAVLFVSGYSPDALEDEPPAEEEWLQKPFAAAELFRKVGDLLASPASAP